MSAAKKNTLLFLLVLIIPPVVLLPAMFFLYPYIQSDKHASVVEQVRARWGMEVDSTQAHTSPLDRLKNTRKEEIQGLTETTEAYKRIQVELENLQQKYILNDQKHIESTDSLKAKIAQLNQVIKRMEDESSLNTVNNIGVGDMFAERAKSLFNLEDEELTPIINQMSNDLLLQLYDVGSTMQRQKLLRCLPSDKAAKIVTLAL
jgi:hypothetical protein